MQVPGAGPPLGPLAAGTELTGVHVQGTDPWPLGKILAPHIGFVPLPGRRRIRGSVLQSLLRGSRELPIVPYSAISPEYSGGPGISHQGLLGSVATVGAIGVSHLMSYDLVPSWMEQGLLGPPASCRGNFLG